MGLAFAIAGTGLLGGLGSIAATKSAAAGKVIQENDQLPQFEKSEARTVQVGYAVGAAMYLAAAALFFVLIMSTYKRK